MAAFIEGVLRAWPDQRILVVTHVRELIAQNYAELIGLWREAPAGIYSAGLGRRDLGARILFAGIQSIHRRAYDVQQCDLVLIDEAHLIPGASDTMYRRFLDTLARINPQLKVIGFTATPYRLDSGMLHEGKGALFTDIAYEVSVRAADRRRLPLPAGQQGGRDQARRRRASAAAAASSSPASCRPRSTCPTITEAAIDEVVRLGADRRSWLAFCAGVEHATHVAEAIRARGFSRRHDLRRHPEARARPHHRRLQARRDQGARLDGRADHRLQRAGRRSHRHAAADEVDRALRADGRPRHPARAGQGRLPGARLRRQRRPARADRRGEAEAPRHRRGRGAGQGLPGLPEHPRDGGPGLPRLRPRLPAAEGQGRGARPRRSRS